MSLTTMAHTSETWKTPKEYGISLNISFSKQG